MKFGISYTVVWVVFLGYSLIRTTFSASVTAELIHKGDHQEKQQFCKCKWYSEQIKSIKYIEVYIKFKIIQFNKMLLVRAVI